MINQLREYRRSHSDVRADVQDFLAAFGCAPEARSRPQLHLPSLKEAYAELAFLRERVRVLEETLRNAGINPTQTPLYP